MAPLWLIAIYQFDQAIPISSIKHATHELKRGFTDIGCRRAANQSWNPAGIQRQALGPLVRLCEVFTGADRTSDLPISYAGGTLAAGGLGRTFKSLESLTDVDDSDHAVKFWRFARERTIEEFLSNNVVAEETAEH